MSRALLLEIGTEDLPARYVVPLANALTRGMVDGLGRRGIGFSGAHTFATPRRLAVRPGALDQAQPEQQIERPGPALAAALQDGKSTPAALGFAKSRGVEFAALGDNEDRQRPSLHYSNNCASRMTSSA